MDQLIRSYNEQDDDDDDEDEDDDEQDNDNDDDEEKKTELEKVEELNVGNYVQSIMDHCANIFNFIYGKLSTIYKNVNADSTIIIDCDCNDNIGKILQFMKDKYLDPNPQTPSIELFYKTTSDNNKNNHKYGGRYVQYTHVPPEEFITNSTIRKYKNAYFASIDSTQGNIVHYVLTKNNKAYIINNEKLGVLIWYFLRCMSNHTSISNSIHIFLSVGKDSSSDYLDFLDITKIEIYSHDKKSYNDVIKEYEDECIICIEYKQCGSGIIAFSNNIVEKLEYISDNQSDKFIPEDALLDFYRLFESGNNDSIINFLIAQLSLQLFHIGVSEWVDIYDIDLLSLYQHSITVAEQKKNGTYVPEKTQINHNDDDNDPQQQDEMDEDQDDDDDDDDEEDDEEDDEDDDDDDDEDEEEDEYDNAAEDEEQEEESETVQESSSYGETEVAAITNKYLKSDDENEENQEPLNQGDTKLITNITEKSISPEVSDVESQDPGLFHIYFYFFFFLFPFCVFAYNLFLNI